MIPSAVKTTRLIFASVLLLIAICSASALIGAYVNTASGGEAIPADTTGGAYTPLTGPEIVETAPGQIGTGTIILAFPAGFEINMSATVAVIVKNLTTNNANNINSVPGGSTALPAVLVDSSHILFNVTSASNGGSMNSLLFVNISVRPTAGTPLRYGNITKSGNSIIAGVANGYSMGTLVEVPGTVTNITVSPDAATIDQGDSVDYTTEGFDAYGNSAGVVTSSTLFGIDLAANGSFSANTYTSQNAGVWTVTGTHSAVIDTATLTVRDITPPVITILGSSNVTVEVHNQYDDEGATALDDTDGNLTGAIITVNTVNQEVLGTYTVTYRVNDSAGNIGVAVRTVNVVDTTLPVITILGENPVAIHYGNTYIDDGATANDNYDGNLTGALVTVINVNTHVLGNQTVTYNVTDSSGNTAHATRIVMVIDKEIPIINLTGTSPVDVPFNTTYVDAGATAEDNADGNITASIITESDVNTSKVGTYNVTYRVSDSSGNVAVAVTRTVNVVDITPPVLTILGDNPATVERTNSYADAGATANDNYDGEITGAIRIFNPVNPFIVGNYTVTYDVNDSSGNSAHAERTVNVVDTTPPELNSAETQDADSDGMIDSIVLTFNENIGDDFLNAGTSDNWDVDGYDNEQIGTGSDANDTILVLTFDESNTSDTGAEPSISYTQGGSPTSTHDLAGNELVTMSTTANDGAKPILTLNGANPMTITTGSTFTDPGANATEQGLITTTGTVNTGAAGTYYIIYQMTDDAGNDAANVTRTVNVVNPVVTGGGGGGGGGSGGGRPTPPTPTPSGGQPFTFPSLPLVTGNSEMQQQNPEPETGNIQPSGETAPEETGDLPIIQPQATGIFNLNTRMKWFGVGILLLLLLALGTYAFRRMRKNSKPQFYP